MEWIFTANKREQQYDLDGALHEQPIFWGQSSSTGTYTVEAGDIVYLYEAVPDKYIRYKCVVLSTDNYSYKRDETKFGGWPIGTPCFDFEIALDYEFNIPIPLEELVKHGISSGRINITKSERFPELFQFLNEYEELDRNGDNFDPETGKEKELTGEERTVTARRRVHQAEFRNRLIKRYEGKCAICGNSEIRVLTASHIKGWKYSNRHEKVDEDNGFLFCPAHDKCFDAGLISFDENGSIMISSSLSEENLKLMNIKKNQKIKLTEGNKHYLEFNRENIFQK